MAETTSETVTTAGDTASPPQVGNPPTGGNLPAAGDAEKLLAGKFKTQADLEKGYKELERKLGERSKPEPKPGEMDLGIKQPEQPKVKLTVDQVVAKAGLKIEDLAVEYANNGNKFTEDTYKKLMEANPDWDRSDIDERAAAKVVLAREQINLATNAKAKCEQLAGGPKELENLLSAAGEFLSPAEVAQFDGMLKNPATAATAVEVLLVKQKNAAGSIGTQISGSTNGTNSTISSLAEYNLLTDKAFAGDQSALQQLNAFNRSGRSVKSLPRFAANAQVREVR